jgi:hypothetical protein
MPPAAALDVERVDRAAAERGVGVLDRQRLVQAVGVDRELDVVAVGEVERAADLLRPGADVLVDLQRSASSTGPGRAEEARTSSAALSGWASSAAHVAASPSAGLAPRFQTGP